MPPKRGPNFNFLEQQVLLRIVSETDPKNLLSSSSRDARLLEKKRKLWETIVTTYNRQSVRDVTRAQLENLFKRLKVKVREDADRQNQKKFSQECAKTGGGTAGTVPAPLDPDEVNDASLEVSNVVNNLCPLEQGYEPLKQMNVADFINEATRKQATDINGHCKENPTVGEGSRAGICSGPSSAGLSSDQSSLLSSGPSSLALSVPSPGLSAPSGSSSGPSASSGSSSGPSPGLSAPSGSSSGPSPGPSSDPPPGPSSVLSSLPEPSCVPPFRIVNAQNLSTKSAKGKAFKSSMEEKEKEMRLLELEKILEYYDLKKEREKQAIAFEKERHEWEKERMEREMEQHAWAKEKVEREKEKHEWEKECHGSESEPKRPRRQRK